MAGEYDIDFRAHPEAYRMQSGEQWANWDVLGMMQQIGAVPTPEKAVAS